MEKECGLKIEINLSTLCLIFFHIYFDRCSSGVTWTLIGFLNFNNMEKSVGSRMGFVCILCVYSFSIFIMLVDLVVTWAFLGCKCNRTCECSWRAWCIKIIHISRSSWLLGFEHCVFYLKCVYSSLLIFQSQHWCYDQLQR